MAAGIKYLEQKLKDAGTLQNAVNVLLKWYEGNDIVFFRTFVEQLPTYLDVDSLPPGGNTGDALVKVSDQDGDVTWAAISGSGAVTWGSILGTLSNQTDLQSALNTKQNILSEGEFVNGDKTKLDNITPNADVTNATTVEAAGALMDNEVVNLNAVKSFDPADYATAAQGSKADSALQSSDIGVSVQAHSTVLDNTTESYTSIDKTKLDNIEEGADVTDFTNVQAAGALMDSEVANLSAVKTFDPADYATAAQGIKADSALQSGASITQLTGTANRLLYINNFGNVTELSLGSNGTFLQSQGTTSAPVWATIISGSDATSIQGEPVTSTTPTDGQILVYRTASNSYVLETKPVASGNPAWGDITGTLSNQTDLQTALNGKQDVLAEGAFVNGDKTKLDGIEALADVTDTDNVRSAGALMDDEVTNLADVKAFDPANYATAAQGTKADSAVQNTGDETIDGIKTFTSSPIVPAPLTDLQAATKKYVDDSITAGGGYTDAQAQDAVGAILTDTAEIDFNYDAILRLITASLKEGSIEERKLDAIVNASLDKADSAVQPTAIQTLTNKTIVDYTNTVHADALHTRAKATENILKGQAVVITGYNAGEAALEIALADNTTGVATGIAYENISVGNFGLIISAGILEDVDTSAFSEGVILYVNGSGNLTPTEPSTGFAQPIAYVLRSNANNGALQILADYPKQDAGDVRFAPYKTILSTRVQNAIQNLEDSKANKSLNLTAGENLVAGDWCYLKSDGKMWKTNASAEATAKGLVVMATETIATDSVGSFQKTSTYTTSGLTVGSEYYLDTTAGAITTTKPTATGTIVRLVGYALSATELYLDIDKTYLENE